MKELLPHISTWLYFIQNVKQNKSQKYTYNMIPYCTKFGIHKLSTLLIKTYAYNVKRKPCDGMAHFRCWFFCRRKKGKQHLRGVHREH